MFLVLLVLRLPRLGKRELILVFFVRLFGLCLFGFVGFLFLFGSGAGLWFWRSLDFSLTFFVAHEVLFIAWLAVKVCCVTGCCLSSELIVNFVFNLIGQ